MIAEPGRPGLSVGLAANINAHKTSGSSAPNFGSHSSTHPFAAEHLSMGLTGGTKCLLTWGLNDSQSVHLNMTVCLLSNVYEKLYPIRPQFSKALKVPCRELP